MNVLAVLYMPALAVAGAFLADAGIEGVSWVDPPYPEVGAASLIALLLLFPHLERGGVPSTNAEGSGQARRT